MFGRCVVRAVVAAAVAAMMSLPSGATAGPTKMKVLGTDPTLDGPVAADLVSLAVATHGSDLHVRIELANALPVQGSYPGAGIEWTFDVKGRRFLAEAHPEPGAMRYTLFEIAGDQLRQVQTSRAPSTPTRGSSTCSSRSRRSARARARASRGPATARRPTWTSTSTQRWRRRSSTR